MPNKPILWMYFSLFMSSLTSACGSEQVSSSSAPEFMQLTDATTPKYSGLVRYDIANLSGSIDLTTRKYVKAQKLAERGLVIVSRRVVDTVRPAVVEFTIRELASPEHVDDQPVSYSDPVVYNASYFVTLETGLDHLKEVIEFEKKKGIITKLEIVKGGFFTSPKVFVEVRFPIK